MNATSRDRSIGACDETIVYAPTDSDAPAPRHAEPNGEAPEMPETMPRGNHRYAFASGARPLDGYTIKRAIGRGGFGEVYYATSDAGKEVALKLITRNLDIERRGVQQCMNLKSPHLITVFDLKISPDGDSWVIMEYVAGPSLESILRDHPGGLPTAEVRTWMKGLVEGVAYLHDHGIVHRDLKPANLFLEDGVVKIGDYGLSKAIAQSQQPNHSESVGTCHYMAPEIASGKYHRPIDIYALGIILYEMITGGVPFDGESVGEVLMKHLTSQPDLSPLAEPYRSIVRRALAKDPNHRPSRVQDLLPPLDAPREPEVRFIGDGRTAPPLDPNAGPPHAPEEDVLHIGAEDSILYIGPDTRPPAPPQARPVRDRRGSWPWLGYSPNRHRPSIRPASPPPPPPPPPVARARVRPAPPPLGDPPPLPSGRVRVSELANSMLLATPLAALAAALCLPAFEVFDLGPRPDPLQLAFLFSMVLLGTWSVLVPSKLAEGRRAASPSGRLLYAGIGLAVGAAGVALAEWTRLRPAAWMGSGYNHDLVEWARHVGPADLVYVLGFVGYFSLCFAAISWRKLSTRDRWARFRLFPAIKAGLIAGLIGLFWPSPQPWGLIVVVLVAIVTQLVSPWSRPAAEYARAARRRRLA